MPREHALVLGAGMAGILAARVLAEQFDRVTIVDRDAPTATAASARKGVPQGRHPHLLLARGADVLEELHPGLLADLVMAGVPVLRWFDRTYLEVSGHRLSQAGTLKPPTCQPARPLLEHKLLARRPQNVAIREQCSAVNLRHESGRVLGARVETPTGPEEITAELVVDATGRAGRTATWLPELGYPAPVEDRLGVDVCYVTATLRLPDAEGRLPQIMIVSACPTRPSGVAAMQIQPDQWQVTAYGYRGHHPAGDNAGILAAYKELAPADWHDALAAAEWADRPAVHRYPYSVRRRYERLTTFPDGLLVVGDGLCSFNPLYGQGMTIAALQALALRDCLAAGDQDLPRRFFGAASNPVGVAWRLSVAGDLAYPTVHGPRPRWIRVVNRCTNLALSAAEADPYVRDAFLRVSWLLDPPVRLAHPRFLRRAALHAVARRRRTRTGRDRRSPITTATT